MVTKTEASAALKVVLGDKVGGDFVADVTLDYVPFLASVATNMHSFSPEAWKSDIGHSGPFASVIDEVRAKVEMA